MDIKCVVAAHNAAGEPDFYFCKVRCTDPDYNDGGHYEDAINAATAEGSYYCCYYSTLGNK